MDYDLIVLGLGPAGAALAFRAQQQGLRVLGIDSQDSWPNTYGMWTDEVPAWLPATFASRCQPYAHGLKRHKVRREYAVLDNVATLQSLLTFPVLKESAEVVSSTELRTSTSTLTAKWVVDARGTVAASNLPIQQAIGVISDRPLRAVWMDLRSPSLQPPSFLYQVPVNGGYLQEETILVTDELASWDFLKHRLEERLGRTITEDEIVEKVAFPMAAPPYSGPAIPFGARAGLVNPITGYSVTSSWMLVDALLTSLQSNKKLPWEGWRFKTDRWLTNRGQTLLRTADAITLAQILDPIFRLPTPLQAGFLRQAAPIRTAIGMLWVFFNAPLHLKLFILQQFFGFASNINEHEWD